MCEDSERGVVGLVRQVQQHFTELSCRVQLWSCPIKPPQAIQDRSKLWRLPYLLTQRVCLGVSALHLGGCVSFRSLQCRAKGNVQGQCLLGMLRCLWQGLEQFDPGGQMADGFQMGRVVAGVLTRSLPVVHCLLSVARGSVVLGHHLGLSLDSLREVCLQELRHLLMHLLPRTPQQRGIGGILDQGMLEHIQGPRRPSPLVEQFGRHQPGQPVLHRGFVLR